MERYKKLLKEDSELTTYIVDKGGELQWFYEKYLYFSNCAGDSCKYADACLKMMKEGIDEFYSSREPSNS